MILILLFSWGVLLPSPRVNPSQIVFYKKSFRTWHFFLVKIPYNPRIFLCQKFLDQKFIDQHIFWQIFFWPTFYFDQTFFSPKFFLWNFSLQFFSEYFFNQIFFRPNICWPKVVKKAPPPFCASPRTLRLKIKSS